MQVKIQSLLLSALLLTAPFVMSQVAGDYRTDRANVTWLTPGDWQRYNGTTWVAATDYPGQNPGTGTVTILNNHGVTLGSSIPNPIGALVYETGNNSSLLTFTGAYTLNVTGAISMNAPGNNSQSRLLAVDAGTLNCGSLSLGLVANDNRRVQLRISTGTVTVGGNLTLNSPGIRNEITINSTGTLNIAGSFTGGGAAGISFAAGSTVNFNGNGAQTIPDYSYQNLTCSGNNVKSAAGSFSVAGTLSIAAGIELSMASFDLSGATLTTSGTGTLTTSSSSANPLPTGRTWSFGVTYDLGGNQTIPVGSYSNLETAGSGIKTLAGSTSVSGTLTFTAGKIDGGTNTLTLTSATPATQVSGGAPTTYIYNTGAGRLRRNNLQANNNYNFPLGSPTYFNPVIVRPLDAVSDFAVSMFEGLNQDGTATGTPLANKNPVVNATWNVDRINGTGDAELTLAWSSALEGSAFATFTGPQIGISHFEFGNWGLNIGSGDDATNTATALFSSFSPFAVGKVGTVLPISFTNLKAYEKQRGVQIDWNVTADKNINTYVVERSVDGRNFSKIGTVTANQSDLSSAYGFYDATPLPGTGYYRITSLQKDGSNSLSAVLRVNLNKSIKETIIYPNPVKGSLLSLQSTNLEKGSYSIRMYSVNGQELLQLRFDHNGGAINQMINLPKNLQPGMYDMMLDKAGNRVMSKKVMVQ
jgi:hypothetical protein